MPKTTSILTGAQSIKNRWLAGLLMTIFCTGAGATLEDEDGARWYQVELILFAHNNPQALDAEQWPEIIGVELPEGLVELQLPQEMPSESAEAVTEIAPEQAPGNDALTMDHIDDTPADTAGETADRPVAFQILDEAEWQLTKTARHLRRSSRFKPLLHVAWRQPTYELARARPVLLYDGMDEPLSIEERSALEDPAQNTGDDIATLHSAYTEAVYATAEDARIGPPNPRLIGTVKLSVARYLHLATDLIYRLPVTQQAAVPVPDFDLWYDRPYPTLYEPQGPAYRLEEWQAIRGFRMQESRRMRSKVLHYLDHPLFGMVVLITPVELPQPDEETEPPATQ